MRANLRNDDVDLTHPIYSCAISSENCTDNPSHESKLFFEIRNINQIIDKMADSWDLELPFIILDHGGEYQGDQINWIIDGQRNQRAIVVLSFLVFGYKSDDTWKAQKGSVGKIKIDSQYDALLFDLRRIIAVGHFSLI